MKAAPCLGLGCLAVACFVAGRCLAPKPPAPVLLRLNRPRSLPPGALPPLDGTWSLAPVGSPEFEDQARRLGMEPRCLARYVELCREMDR